MLIRIFPFLFVVFLAACAVPPPPAATPTVPAATVTAMPPTLTPEPPTATPEPPTATPEPLALTIWLAEDEQALPIISAALNDVAAELDIRISLVARPADALRLSLATAELLGEPPPDLIWGDGNLLVGLLADGALQPLPADAAAGMLPALVTAARSGGEIWGAPMLARNGLLLLYNPALANEPPATSDELIVRSRAAATPLVAGMVMAWDEARWLAPWLYAFGGTLTDPAGELPTLESPEMVAALNLLRELYRSAPTNGDDYRRGQRLLAQGYAAYAVDGDWSLAQYRTLSETLTLELAPLPLVPASGRRATPLLDGDFLLFQRDLAGPQRDLALELLRALQSPQCQLALATALTRLPANPLVLDDPQLAADPVLATQLPFARQAPGLPPTNAARCALWGIDVWLPSLISGRFEAEEIATRMQREAEACLGR
ncbi:MAG: extracellular solute-binding protein [Oscillochloris sp.]|nr:extracellular solute-binding protein [Oscillochloris sp.]